MKWYGASAFFEAQHVPPSSVPTLWEEKIFLVQAHSTEEAVELAREVSMRNEVSYEAADGSMAHWKFSKIERINELDFETVASGAEVFSRFLRASEVESLSTPFD